MRRTVLLFALLVLAGGCRQSDPEPAAPQNTETSIPFRIDGELTFLRDGQPITSIAIEVADTDSSRARGLMDRSVIPPATGMLFVFPREEMQGFWMQSTPSALDIMFFDADSTLINVEANAVPYQTTPTYDSDAPAQFVVETPAGFARRYGLTPGVTIDWRLDSAAADSALVGS